MKRALLVILAAVLALPLFADERQEKQQLIRELLEIIDTKTLTQASYDLMFNRLGEDLNRVPEEAELDDEGKAQYAESIKKQREQMNAFRERLFTRIDYAKYADEIYAPLFDKTYTTAELRELIAFYKTKAGQKSARLLPELSLGGMMKGMAFLEEEARKIGDEMAEEERKKNPAPSTMADMRTLATAIEAYATDTNEYPKVTTVEALKPILSPTYIRDIPMKDGWGTTFAYASDGKHYRIASAGSDKHFDWNAKQIESLPENFQTRGTESDEADLIFQDGNFVQAPKKSIREF